MAIEQNIRLTVDVALFAWSSQGLELLLIQRKNDSWALPGGFVDDREELKVAAKRELEEETGAKINDVIQFYTYGDDVNRDPRGHTVSVGHLAVKLKENLNIKAASDAKSAKWVKIQEVPSLAFDHNKIVDRALTHLKLTLQCALPDIKSLQNEISEKQLGEIKKHLKSRI